MFIGNLAQLKATAALSEVSDSVAQGLDVHWHLPWILSPGSHRQESIGSCIGSGIHLSSGTLSDVAGV